MNHSLNKTLRLIGLTFLWFIAGTICAYAQNNYKTALGLRLNEGAGITVKHFLNDKNSLEGILYTRWRGVILTGLYQANVPVFSEPGFLFLMGGGAHVGVWDRERHPWWKEEDQYDTRAAIGLDGQIGLDYSFQSIPLNMALDWKPAMNLVGASNFWADDFALSIRYAFK